MKILTRILKEGYDGKKCLVHARSCVTPEGRAITTSRAVAYGGGKKRQIGA